MSAPDGGSPASPPGCDAGPVNTCGSLVGPSTVAQCKSCSSYSSSCQPNGCYGGWWCDTSDNKCQAPPTNCSGSGGGGGGGCSDAGTVTVNGGGPVGGTVGANGGKVSRLLFAVVGDTRPANEDDTSGYPTAIIDQIYTDIAGLNPMPTFTVGTGDYQFASPSGSQSPVQIGLYMAARAKYSGTFYPAMGNHECTGATASNCGQGNADGITSNLSNFITTMLGPIKQTSPYYAVNVDATDGTWTSKFVFVAGNAWDSGQSSWLSGVMANKTTYTFVIRHEQTGTSGPPGVAPSDSIISGFPYTLLIVGHTHTYEHRSTQQIIIGNGGAPITGSGNYGFGLISQRSDGALTVDVIDYQSNQADPSFHFVITAGGTLTQ
jgi:predicted phosphodiesterase